MTKREANHVPDWLQRSWDSLGHSDPMWSILTADDKRGNRWDPDDFFETGRADCADALAWAGQHAEMRFERALDFGCGVGRVTQALAAEFDSTVGVDLAASMIRQATDLNRWPERCRYLHNPKPHLALLASSSFDFVYTKLTLQHMPTPLALAYTRELGRVLRPNGVITLQTATSPRAARRLLSCRRWWRRLWRHHVRRRPLIEVFAHPATDVRTTLEASGVEVLATRSDDSIGPHWRGEFFLGRKQPS